MGKKVQLLKILNPKAPIYYDHRPPLTHDEISTLILMQGYGRLSAKELQKLNKHKSKTKAYWSKVFKSLVFKEFVEKVDESRPAVYELLDIWRIDQTGPNFFLNYKPGINSFPQSKTKKE